MTSSLKKNIKRSRPARRQHVMEEATCLTPEESATFASFVEDIAEDFDSEALRSILADWLADRPPVPVIRKFFPNWLREAWMDEIDDNLKWRLSKMQVANLVQDQLNVDAGSRHFQDWGTTNVAGRLCFVDDRQGTVGSCSDLYRWVAGKTGSVDVFCRVEEGVRFMLVPIKLPVKKLCHKRTMDKDRPACDLVPWDFDVLTELYKILSESQVDKG